MSNENSSQSLSDDIQPSISDGSITLRSFNLADVLSLFEAARESIDEASPWLPWCHRDYTMEESLEWILGCTKSWAAGSEYDFAIVDNQTHTLVGGVGINQLDRQNSRANLGYWVRTGWGRRGIATSAARMAAIFSFQTLKLARLEITVAAANKASRRVAEKLGAKYEGRLPQNPTNREPQDARLYTLHSNQWMR